MRHEGILLVLERVSELYGQELIRQILRVGRQGQELLTWKRQKTFLKIFRCMSNQDTKMETYQNAESTEEEPQ